MNMEFKRKLPTPQTIRDMYPVSPELARQKQANDRAVRDVLTGEDDRLMLLIGPCSADREDAVLDYVTRLRGLQEKCPVVSTVLMIKLVRDYFLQECGPIPPLLHQHSYLPIYRSLYSFFAAQADAPSDATSKLTARLLELFAGEGLSLGDVVDSVLATAVVMDMTKKEGICGDGE